jgi:hypothetical protein
MSRKLCMSRELCRTSFVARALSHELCRMSFVFPRDVGSQMLLRVVILFAGMPDEPACLRSPLLPRRPSSNGNGH